MPVAKGLEIEGIGSFGDAPEPVEDGTSFEENAAIKAVKYSIWLKREHNLDHPVIAEDSGLEVEGLLGWPGVMSARIAETDAECVQLVLEKLGDHFNRAAQFVAATALAINGYLIKTWRGQLTGILTSAPRGENGFGYDPIFELPGRGLTTAELSRDEKNRISHRYKSWNKALDYVRRERLTH